jgi:ATP-binding cassette, subfamily B, bacterial
MSIERPKSTNTKSLSGLLPFLKPYRGRIGLALLFLVLAAAATLVFPIALRSLIDGGLVQNDKGAQVMALREHFAALFAVAVALAGRARDGRPAQRGLQPCAQAKSRVF